MFENSNLRWSHHWNEWLLFEHNSNARIPCENGIYSIDNVLILN